jgi:hypothetical protein
LPLIGRVETGEFISAHGGAGTVTVSAACGVTCSGPQKGGEPVMEIEVRQLDKIETTTVYDI